MSDTKRGYSTTEISEETGVPLRTVQKACENLEPLYDYGRKLYDLDEALKAQGYRYAKRPGRPRKHERVA